MKKEAILVLLILLVSTGLVSALKIGNNSVITDKYAPEGFIEGWINISFNNTPLDWKFTSNFNGEKSIEDLLDRIDYYDCLPYDCGSTYSIRNPESVKSFYISTGKKELGIVIQDDGLDEIRNVSFNIKSSASGCGSPFSIKVAGATEWRYSEISSNYSCGPYNGCFTTAETIRNKPLERQKPYCQKISLPDTSSLMLGVWLKKVGSAKDITISLYSGNRDFKKQCKLPEATADGGYVECQVNETISRGDYFVCIKSSSDSADYEIRTETTSPCGFFGDPQEVSNYTIDYDVYAKAAKFVAPNFVFNERKVSTIRADVMTYINDFYDGDCSDGCIIPIEINSSMPQTIEISNLSLRYIGETGTENVDSIYDATKTAGRVSSDFIKLDIGEIFKLPSGYGNKTFNLYLNGTQIIPSKNIRIETLPLIKAIIPRGVVLGEETAFLAVVTTPSGVNVSSYNWDFGDGTTKETTKAVAVHKYVENGEFEIAITANSNSGSISKTFSVAVVSNREGANSTIAKAKQRISAIRSSISGLWFKDKVEKELDLDGKEADLENLEDKLVTASTPAEFAAIVSNVSGLDIPDKVRIIDEAKTLFINEGSKIDLSLMRELSPLDVSGRESKFKDAIVAWMIENADVKIEQKAIVAERGSESEVLFTFFKFDISKETDDNLFFVLKEEAEFKDLIEKKVQNYPYLEINENKVVEFFIVGDKKYGELEAFISPKLSSLEVSQSINNDCDYDKKCEAGEDSGTCRSDCKPWGLMLLWLLILLVLALCAYIALQEWYKRRYEKYLFKSPEQLYNLINYIHNAKNQGLPGDVARKKLREKGWKNEQIEYAFKKYNGQRTGMWEIPVFKWVENKKVKEEIAKRQARQQPAQRR